MRKTRYAVYMTYQSIFRTLSLFAFWGLIGIWLSACASVLPVPGGDSTTNKDFYENESDLTDALERIQIGMSKERVFSHLLRTEDDFQKMDRSEIIKVIYGGNNVTYGYGQNSYGITEEFLSSLSGYKFKFTVVKTNHGFSSPIRIRTTEYGYDYEVSLIFQHDVLIEEPIMSGGDVNNTNSGTIFDFISPGFVLDRTM